MILSPSTDLSSEDDRFLKRLARRISDAGLAAPAVLWLASLRPVSFIGSQVLHMAAPLLDVIVPDDGVARLARILETRANLDRFLALIESPDTPDGAAS